MRRRLGLVSLLLGAGVSVAGCATTHVQGEFRPEERSDLVTKGQKRTLASGNEFPLFWGLVEVGKSDVNKKLLRQVREGEVITDMEIRDHVSIPGALLFIVTAGIVSHHDIEVRGRIAQAPEKDHATPGTSAEPGFRGDRTMIIVPVAPLPSGYTKGGGDAAARPETALGGSERDCYAETTIDRPVSEIASSFNEAATRAGLISLGDIDWARFGGGRAGAGGVEAPRLDAAATQVHTFHVADDRITKRVLETPERGLLVPSVVVYEASGKTKVLYGRPTVMLEQLKARGLLSSEKADEHLEHAKAFEANLEKLVENLRTSRGS